VEDIVTKVSETLSRLVEPYLAPRITVPPPRSFAIPAEACAPRLAILRASRSSSRKSTGYSGYSFEWSARLSLVSPRPSEVASMSIEKKFGVECKNPQCGECIVLGMYMKPPQSTRDFVNFVMVGHWKLTCRSCGDVYDYDQADLRECS